MNKVLKLLGGSAFLALVQFLTMPVISRLFSEEALGNYIFFVSLFSVLAIFFTGRLDLHLLQVKNYKSLFFGGVVLSSVIFSIILIATIFFASNVYVYSVLSGWIVSVSSFFYYLSLKKNHLNLVFFSRLGQGGVFFALVFLSYFINISEQLIWIEIFSRLIVLAIFFIYFVKPSSFDYLRDESAINSDLIFTIELLNKYKVFFLTALLGALAIHLNVFLFNFYLSAYFVAMYFFVFKTLSMPVSLVSKPISDTLLSEVNNCKSKGESKNILVLYLKHITIMSVAVYLYVFVNADLLFTTLFGSTWQEIGSVGRLLSLVMMFWAFVTPLSSMLFYCNKQKTGLCITFLDIGIKVLAICLGLLFSDEFITLKAYVLLTSLLYFSTLWRILYYFDVSIFIFIRCFLKCLLLFSVSITSFFYGLEKHHLLLISSLNVVIYFIWFYHVIFYNRFKKLAKMAF
ncbi:lipopolysaccharide biosynthesis protein [Pseudoalteromonas sp. ASV78]|uniref:lipopolysaccharide biosynthesis protein n=1 Tax=Pseudoalteromonas sp. ASV78 TaxID=3397851 RepID=UPI0039FD79D3